MYPLIVHMMDRILSQPLKCSPLKKTGGIRARREVEQTVRQYGRTEAGSRWHF